MTDVFAWSNRLATRMGLRSCRLCGHVFEVGDRVVRKHSLLAQGRYYCAECWDNIGV